jgi:hypothetical protein
VSGRLAAADRLRDQAREPFIIGVAGFLADVNVLTGLPHPSGPLGPAGGPRSLTSGMPG